MKTLSRILTALLASAFAFHATAAAQSTGAGLQEVSFTVTHDEALVTGAKVVAINGTSGARVDSAYTDAEGHATLRLSLTTVASEPTPDMADGYAVSLYPNPASYAVRAQLTSPRPQRLEVVTFDLLGRAIARLRTSVGRGETALAVPGVEGLLAGTYFVRFRFEDAQITRPLVVAPGARALPSGIASAPSSHSVRSQVPPVQGSSFLFEETPYTFEISADGYTTTRTPSITVGEASAQHLDIELFTVTIAGNVEVLGEQALGEVRSVSPDQRTMVLSAEAASALEVGEVVVAGLSPHTPTGLLRRIAGREETADGAVTLALEEASLADVFTDGEVEFQQAFSELVPEDAAEKAAGQTRAGSELWEVAHAVPGVSFSDGALQLSDVALYEGGGLRVSIPSGTVAFTPHVEVFTSYDESSLNGFTIMGAGHLRTDLDVKVEASGAVSADRSVELFRLEKLLVTLVGSVPVVWRPSLAFELRGAVEVQAEVEATMGFTYDQRVIGGGTFTAPNSIEAVLTGSDDFERKPLEFEGSASYAATVGVSPVFGIDFYPAGDDDAEGRSSFGPVVRLDPSLTVEQNVTVPELSWDAELTGALDASLQFDLRQLDLGLRTALSTGEEGPRATIWAAPDSVEVVGRDSLEGEAGTELEEPVRVRVFDSWGEPLSRAVVRFAPVGGAESGGRPADEFVMTDEDGIAETYWTLGEDGCDFALQAEVLGGGGSDDVRAWTEFAAVTEGSQVDPLFMVGSWTRRWIVNDGPGYPAYPAGTLYQVDDLVFYENGRFDVLMSNIVVSDDPGSQVSYEPGERGGTWSFDCSDSTVTLHDFGVAYRFEVDYENLNFLEHDGRAHYLDTGIDATLTREERE